MARKLTVSIGAGAVLFLLPGRVITRAQEPAVELAVEHPECSLFGPKRDAFLKGQAGAGKVTSVARYALSAMTGEVSAAIGSYVPGGSRTHGFSQNRQPASIDSYIYADLQAAGITPAAKTSDFEFIRRVTLDLTGRIPTPERVQSFVADTAPDKRAQLIEELIAKPEWADKWTMYFGDLYGNNANNPTSGINRYPEGRNAFYRWIKDSLSSGKPYNTMATQLISSIGTNSYQQGELNWLVGGIVTGGPQQDVWDQQAANVSETFLGISHMNCILCHNGRGHLDALSLWGKGAVRTQAWGLSAFLARTTETRTPVDPAAGGQPYYWAVNENPRAPDYPLNTTTGNRPARQPIGTTRNSAPIYPFSGRAPNPGENYRVALTREVTSDFQFARAAVNYIWKEFFGRGIVEPANQMDPSRLDPENPPTALDSNGDPWPLQPSNARLLNALAQRFIDGGYNLKSLMREIANSDAYQLSSRYDGTWNPEWEKYFARKFVRRLWAEEIHDAVAQSSGIFAGGGNGYNVGNFSNLGFGPVLYAMQLPDTVRTPDGGGAVSQFLDAFLRGNRDDEDRRSEGSVIQALELMNDNFVMSRIRATGTNANKLLRNYAGMTDEQLVSNVFLGILSRYPTDSEKSAAIASLQGGTRSQKAENLVWSLYNKVDFIFNY